MEKYFCERDMMSIISTKPTTEERMAASAMVPFVTSIMTSEPTKSVTLETSMPMLWLSVWPMVSTSFVTRLSTSPKECLL